MHVRAVVVGPEGEPALADVPEPEGPGVTVRVLGCGLCGSDVEKLDAAHAGSILGHEVVAETADGRRVALVHHAPCGECARCLDGHESTCERFAAPTIRPGGFAERVRAQGSVEIPAHWPDWRGTMVEPLACVLVWLFADHEPSGSPRVCPVNQSGPSLPPEGCATRRIHPRSPADHCPAPEACRHSTKRAGHDRRGKFARGSRRNQIRGTAGGRYHLRSWGGGDDPE